MRTSFQTLHLYKSSFQCQVTTLTQKIFLLAYIKATVKAFWWGDLLKFPHLIATKMAFWLGAFSKIQSMLTNSLSPNSLGNNPNLRQQRKILIYCHKTAGFRGYILKIYPSIFVKVNFGENLRRFTKNSSHLYKNYFQFTLDALKNYFSHLIAVGNAKIKRGCANFSLIL